MNRIGFIILVTALLLGSSCKSQNFFWSHTYEATPIGDITQEYCKVPRDLETLDGLSSVSGMSFKDDGTKIIVYGYNASPSASYLYEYTLSTPWLLNTASLTNSINISTDIGSPSTSSHLAGSFVDKSGTYVYVITNGGVASDEYIYRFTLGDSWSLGGTVTLTDQIIINPGVKTEEIYGLHFSSDGSTMWMVERSSDEYREYSLSTPWLVSTATETQSLDLSAYATNNIIGGHFNDAGDRLYMVSRLAESVLEFELTTPFDISTVNLLNTAVKTPTGTYLDAIVTESGDYMYILTYNDAMIYQICLTE